METLRVIAWQELPATKLSEQMTRRLLSGQQAMLSWFEFQEGAVVPWHQHENEQFTYVLQGLLRLRIGVNPTQEVTLAAGEVVYIPANVPHEAEALEATVSLDVFSPPRQDWLSET
jgi:quercetin dioxygenase-like cupin family protein